MLVLRLSSMSFGRDRGFLWSVLVPQRLGCRGSAKVLIQLSPQASDLQTSEHGIEIIRHLKAGFWQRLGGVLYFATE